MQNLKKKSVDFNPRYEGSKLWNVVDFSKTNEANFMILGGIVDPIDAHEP
jgi:hypothetical protein